MSPAPFLRSLATLAMGVGLMVGCHSTSHRYTRSFEVMGLDGTRIRLAPDNATRAWVFVFVSVECPISNRCLPEVMTLAEEAVRNGIRFVFVYPNADELPEKIRKHQREFSVSCEVYRDPLHTLARQLDAHVTPEVVMLGTDGSLIYRGRVNDQYLALGRGRPEPTQHDLADAVRQFHVGQAMTGVVHPAVGCTFRASH